MSSFAVLEDTQEEQYCSAVKGRYGAFWAPEGTPEARCGRITTKKNPDISVGGEH